MISSISSFSSILIPSDESRDLQCIRMESHRIEAIVEEFLGRSVKLSLLSRPSGDSAGLYAYSSATATEPNVRATRLAMACGLLSLRFMGDILLIRSKGSFGHVDLTMAEIFGACCCSPDLRNDIQLEMSASSEIPEYLALAAQNNYHDSIALAHFAAVMSVDEPFADKDSENDDGISSASDQSHSINVSMADKGLQQENVAKSQFVARSSLCLHCRGPSTSLCQGCQGAYFCAPPRRCKHMGWSHDSVCSTWRRYTNRREALSVFPFEAWHIPLLGRDCQLSDESYRRFLHDTMGIAQEDSSSWWRTETDGWAGGESSSAKTVDIRIRRSYAEGFAPLRDFPPEQRVSEMDIVHYSLSRNACGLLKLPSWKEYYDLRGIKLSSPCALLLSFPLTIYHAVVEYGEVPVTVAKMLSRPMRIHVVGIEKELNFIDLFKEIGLLLPENIKVRSFFRVNAKKGSPSITNENVSIHRLKWYSSCERTCYHQVVEAIPRSRSI